MYAIIRSIDGANCEVGIQVARFRSWWQVAGGSSLVNTLLTSCMAKLGCLTFHAVFTEKSSHHQAICKFGAKSFSWERCQMQVRRAGSYILLTASHLRPVRGSKILTLNKSSNKLMGNRSLGR
jgi:hypothetical protein